MEPIFGQLTLKERIILAPKLASNAPWSPEWWDVWEESGHWFRFYAILRYAHENCV